MSIEQVIYLWNKSNYEKLCIKDLPVVNHVGDIVCGICFYNKGQIILCGGKIPVYDYLKNIYKDYLFIFKDVKDYIIIEKFCKVGVL